MENTNKHSMNISEFILFFFHDKWSATGGLGAVCSFLITFAQLNTVIATTTAIIGLGVAVLSFYKLFIQVSKEKYEFEQLVKKNERAENDENE